MYLRGLLSVLLEVLIPAGLFTALFLVTVEFILRSR